MDRSWLCGSRSGRGDGGADALAHRFESLAHLVQAWRLLLCKTLKLPGVGRFGGSHLAVDDAEEIERDVELDHQRVDEHEVAERQRAGDHADRRAPDQQHDGQPATVEGTCEPVGVLRIDFPGGAGQDRLRHVDWETWFYKFDTENLAFLYQERKASGEDSTFFKLVSRD